MKLRREIRIICNLKISNMQLKRKIQQYFVNFKRHYGIYPLKAYSNINLRDLQVRNSLSDVLVKNKSQTFSNKVVTDPQKLSSLFLPQENKLDNISFITLNKKIPISSTNGQVHVISSSYSIYFPLHRNS